jgi:hypothetical protein
LRPVPPGEPAQQAQCFAYQICLILLGRGPRLLQADDVRGATFQFRDNPSSHAGHSPYWPDQPTGRLEQG